MGWLLSVKLLEDRFIIVLFSLFKFGFILTNQPGFQGFSIIVGFYRLEAQVNLSVVKSYTKIERFREHETGKA